MASLLAASRTQPDTTVVRQARATAATLDELRSGGVDSATYTFARLAAQLRSTASDIDDSIAFSVGDVDPALVMGAESARALGAGMAEAIRNVGRHAGPEARCEVRVASASGAVRVDVVDDGRGFDPAAVPVDRLGLAVSIRARFAELPGGWAEIESTVGRGTRVSMGWAA